MTYAIATLYLCSLLVGCITATRSYDKSNNWLMADSKEECERLNTEFTTLLVRLADDTLIGVRVECSKVVGV